MADTKVAGLFRCETCDYTCKKKSDYKKHLLTAKHKRLTEKSLQDMDFVCHCGKIYSHRQSLYKHKKNCKSAEQKIDELLETAKQLLKENKEIKEKLEEHQTTQINNFNLHVYLNEKCKDAINLKEFVSKMVILPDDLDRVINKGLEYSVTNLFCKSLSEIGETDRPIQCSDLKRDVLYVKDEDVWQKDQDAEKLKRSIQTVQDKHIKEIHKWKDEQTGINSVVESAYIDLISKVTSDVKMDHVSKQIMKMSKIKKS